MSQENKTKLKNLIVSSLKLALRTSIPTLVILLISYQFIGLGLVKGSSMEPSLYENDLVLVDKRLDPRDFKRGDVILFQSPFDLETSIYCKRIIGLPGDEIRLRDGQVYINNTRFIEAYLGPLTKTKPYLERKRIVVPKDQVYVLGDNRPNSSDSRSFGPIKTQSIIGQVKVRIFPFVSMGKIN